MAETKVCSSCNKEKNITEFIKTENIIGRIVRFAQENVIKSIGKIILTEK